MGIMCPGEGIKGQQGTPARTPGFPDLCPLSSVNTTLVWGDPRDAVVPRVYQGFMMLGMGRGQKEKKKKNRIKQAAGEVCDSFINNRVNFYETPWECFRREKVQSGLESFWKL